MATNSFSVLPTTLLSTTSSLLASLTSTSIYPTATQTQIFNSTCNSTIYYNTTTHQNTTSLICSSGGSSFPYWIFLIWPLDFALIFVAGVIIWLLGLIFIKVCKTGCCGLCGCLGWGVKGMGRGARGVGRGVGRKVGQTKEWNVKRKNKAKERKEAVLEKKRGTIALEAIE